MAAPTSGMTQYTFELWPILQEGDDPNYVVSSTPPYWSVPSTTNTFVNYGLLESGSFPLTVGQTYVWRVTATDGSGRALFTNDGHSQVCTFTYGNVAASLLDGVTLQLNANGTGQTVGTADWNGSNLFDSYVLEVRKTGNPDYNWFPINTINDKEEMYMLEPDTEYECRVKGQAGGAETDWSNTAIFTTQPERNYECGSTALPGKPANVTPLQHLLPGMKVQTGQFVMEVLLAEPAESGLPGRFKGTGKIPITFLATANVEFEDILVDENLIHYDGRIDVMTEDLLEWIDAHDNVQVPGIITDYHSNPADSTVIIYLDGGDSMSFDWPAPGNTTDLVDENGFIYTIDEYGNVTITAPTRYDNDNLDGTADHHVYFTEHPQQTYGFDRLKFVEWTFHYPLIKLQDSTDYFVSYKSLASGESDVCYAVVHSNQNFTPVFKTGTGAVLPATAINDSTYEVTIDGFTEEQNIYAYDDDDLKIGKVKLKVYEPKVNELVIIPVNGAQALSASAIENAVNEIFNQGVAQFNVHVNPNFQFTYDQNGNGLDAASDETMSMYSAEMKALRNEYFDKNEKGDSLYLFVVPQIEGNTAGYMVRSRIVGFIQAGEDARTYAHELGHGAFGLEHSFPSIEEGQSNNLLDYNTETHLTHAQWYEMHNFVPSWSFLDAAEDGALQDISDIVKFHNNTKMWVGVEDKYGFVLLDGTPIKIPGITEAIFDIKGKVYKFKTANETYMPYFAESSVNADQYYITGYYSEQDITTFASMPANSVDKKEALKNLRFEGYGNLDARDSLFSKFPKIEFGVYSDCYCEQRWLSDTLVLAANYNSENSNNWFIPNLIKYSINQSGDVHYSNCSGNCFDYSNYNVEGPVEVLIPQLTQHFSNITDIIDIVEFIHSKIPENQTFVFYSSEGAGELDRYFTTWITDKLPAEDLTLATFLVDNGINSLAKFKSAFGETTTSSASDVDVIFSKVDLWENVNKQTYNSNTTDYVKLKNTGVHSVYHYSYKDLVYRDRYRSEGGVIWTGILHNENEGFGEPIYLENGYDQYVAKYGTNSAAFALMESFVQTMGPVFIAFSGYQMVAAFAGVSVGAAVTEVAQFARAVAPIISNLIRQYVTKRARQAIIAGIKSYVAYVLIDATLRYLMDLEPDYQLALAAVDQDAAILQGTTDGLAAFIDMPDLDMSLFQALGTCMVGMEEADNNGTSQSEQCLFNAMVSMIASNSGNIVQILINRVKALGAKSTSFLNMLRIYLDPSDPFYDNFDLPPVNLNLLNSLKNKFSGYQNILDWLDQVGDNKILEKLDELPSNSYSNLEDDILELKNSFVSNPDMIPAWNRINGAPAGIRRNINLLEDIVTWPNSWNINVVNNTIEVVQNNGRKIATVTETKIIAPARTEIGIEGNRILNRIPLVKNAIYDVDGFLYHTDDFGRVFKTSGDLDDHVRVRLGNQQIKAVDIKDGISGSDQGGHIIAARFFGPGEQINLYSQSATLNNTAWKEMENLWAQEMVAGKDVKVQIEAIFTGNSQRPDAFDVSFWIEGVKTNRTFINE
jgi:hypothetical protein